MAENTTPAPAFTVREGSTLTRKQRRIVDAMNAGIADRTWEVLSNRHGMVTLRHMRTADTPEYALGEGFGKWPEPTYFQIVFLTIVQGNTWSLTSDICRCPWVSNSGGTLTMDTFLAILADPGSVL